MWWGVVNCQSVWVVWDEIVKGIFCFWVYWPPLIFMWEKVFAISVPGITEVVTTDGNWWQHYFILPDRRFEIDEIHFIVEHSKQSSFRLSPLIYLIGFSTWRVHIPILTLFKFRITINIQLDFISNLIMTPLNIINNIRMLLFSYFITFSPTDIYPLILSTIYKLISYKTFIILFFKISLKKLLLTFCHFRRYNCFN